MKFQTAKSVCRLAQKVGSDNLCAYTQVGDSTFQYDYQNGVMTQTFNIMDPKSITMDLSDPSVIDFIEDMDWSVDLPEEDCKRIENYIEKNTKIFDEVKRVLNKAIPIDESDDDEDAIVFGVLLM